MSRILIIENDIRTVEFPLLDILIPQDMRGFPGVERVQPEDIVLNLDVTDDFYETRPGAGRRQHRGSGAKREFDASLSRQQRRALEREQKRK